MNKRPLDSSSFPPGKDRHHILRGEIARLNALERPVRVLEWGSGLSTVLLHETLKQEASILSIEHDEAYRFDIPEELSRRLTQLVIPVQKSFGQSGAYVTCPVTDFLAIGMGYDLILIDGRNRADCLAIAAMLLNPGGAIILCDAERELYQHHYNLFRDIRLHLEPDSNYRIAVLRQPVCSLKGHDSLTSGAVAAILPERKPIPCTWGVCAVALPRESYYWLKDWIDHHIRAGASKVAIYDNTGSIKSSRGSSAFYGGYFQRGQVSKRGEEYGRLTAHLPDEQIECELRELAAEYGGTVEIIDWRPRCPKDNAIIHGQVEAYCDFIRRHKDTLGWGLFIDMDEYVYCRPGLSVGAILRLVEDEYPSVSALHLGDWEFECRWGKDGPKDIARHVVHHPTKHDCGKTFARLQDVTHANVHCDWIFRELCTRMKPLPEDMAFAHYKQLPENLANGSFSILPRAFLDTPADASLRPRLTTHFHIGDCGAPALPVDTTFVNMGECIDHQIGSTHPESS